MPVIEGHASHPRPFVRLGSFHPVLSGTALMFSVADLDDALFPHMYPPTTLTAIPMKEITRPRIRIEGIKKATIIPATAIKPPMIVIHV